MFVICLSSFGSETLLNWLYPITNYLARQDAVELKHFTRQNFEKTQLKTRALQTPFEMYKSGSQTVNEYNNNKYGNVLLSLLFSISPSKYSIVNQMQSELNNYFDLAVTHYFADSNFSNYSNIATGLYADRASRLVFSLMNLTTFLDNNSSSRISSEFGASSSTFLSEMFSTSLLQNNLTISQFVTSKKTLRALLNYSSTTINAYLNKKPIYNLLLISRSKTILIALMYCLGGRYNFAFHNVNFYMKNSYSEDLLSKNYRTLSTVLSYNQQRNDRTLSFLQYNSANITFIYRYFQNMMAYNNLYDSVLNVFLYDMSNLRRRMNTNSVRVSEIIEVNSNLRLVDDPVGPALLNKQALLIGWSDSNIDPALESRMRVIKEPSLKFKHYYALVRNIIMEAFSISGGDLGINMPSSEFHSGRMNLDELILKVTRSSWENKRSLSSVRDIFMKLANKNNFNTYRFNDMLKTL